MTEKVGESASDWYLEKFPAGGFMIATGAFGNVFLSQGDEDLELIARMDGDPGDPGQSP